MLLDIIDKNTPAPIFEMRLYPESRYLYFTVHVWAKKRGMIKFLRSTGMKGPAEAVCMGVRREDASTARLLPHIGYICFHAEYIPYPVIIHELGHAAIEWGRRKKLNIDMNLNGFTEVSQDEERILRAQESMCYYLMEKLHNSGVV